MPVQTTVRARGLAASAGMVSLALVMTASTASAELVFGVTADQTLVSFDSAQPSNVLTGAAISGLQSNETIRGIDFRPATGELYAIGSFSNLYTINPSTGAATQVGSTFSTLLNGSSFGFDFNPTIDRIRITSDANQNLVVNPDTGAVQLVATPLFYAAGDANEGTDPNVVGSAYTNSFDGATSTQLISNDTGLDELVTQANNSGVLETVGSLGVDLNDRTGFDISGASGIAYAAVANETLSETTFWTIDLATGNAAMIGEVGGGALVTAIAVVPAPGACGLLAAGGLVALRRRR